MAPVRLWHGSRVVGWWVASAFGFFVARWLLVRGVFRAEVRDGRIERIGGFWSADFASLMTVVLAGILVLVLGWLTGSWIAGRRERAASRRHAASGGRSILM